MARNKQDPPPRTAWTVPEVATSLGISDRQAYLMCERGELRCIRIGRRVVVPVAVLDEFIAAALAAAS